MERAHIRYRSGYKYQLVAEYTVKLGMMPGEIIRIEFIELATSGDLGDKARVCLGWSIGASP
jgi:hypothetical protein